LAKSDNSSLSMKMKLTGTDRSHPFPLSLLAGVDLESINSSSKSTSPRDVNRTVYGYGRTPYGNYTASDRTVY